jgi:serine O-acetyltransferase
MMFGKFKEDLDRYTFLEKGKSWLFVLLTKQGLWALLEYRFGHWVRTSVHIPGLRQGLKLLSFVWHKWIETITGIDLPSEAEVGEGLYIPHFSGIFVHCDVKMGKYCTISQNVTIGIGGRGENQGVPKIGDRVYIAPGAKVFGNITIGDDVAIGANAVVTKDLPPMAVAVGIPAKVISYKGSKDFIIYRDNPVNPTSPSNSGSSDDAPSSNHEPTLEEALE